LHVSCHANDLLQEFLQCEANNFLNSLNKLLIKIPGHRNRWKGLIGSGEEMYLGAKRTLLTRLWKRAQGANEPTRA
jgi:hypothetical protein